MGPTGLLDPLLAHARLRAVYSDAARLQRMLDFEAALALAEAAVGAIPADCGPAIAAHCQADRFDLAQLAEDAALAGNLAIPMVCDLTARVRTTSPEAAKFVHWGATSQDAIDTGAVLQLREALVVLDDDLAVLEAALAGLAHAHRSTPQVARTLLQHALPSTFGAKVAHWLDAVSRQRRRLAGLRPRVLALQFGGAAGTLASLGEHGSAVAAALASRLDLSLPSVPWHTDRDRFAEAACAAGLLVGSLGKLARDISLLSQTEIGEVREGAVEGRGGSSTLPHKRNPAGCAAVLAAAVRVPGLVATMLSAMVQEHERGVGNWQAEWSVLPELMVLAGGALRHTVEIVGGLEVDAARMARNLGLTGGLLMAEAASIALGASLGRGAAHRLVERACRVAQAEGRALRDVLQEMPEIAARLDRDALDRLMDERRYLGRANEFVDRAIAQVGTSRKLDGDVE
jgi:3-carboxy-cis,cis-muconate cycloisomerase